MKAHSLFIPDNVVLVMTISCNDMNKIGTIENDAYISTNIVYTWVYDYKILSFNNVGIEMGNILELS